MGEWRLTQFRQSRFDRRAVSKALSRLAAASVSDILVETEPPAGRARVLGITGSPGAGKSTLIGRLAVHRLQRADSLAVVAIDPTSPRSCGSLLGDRIRMENLSVDPRVYIRSLPSRTAEDGLTDNLAEMVAVLDGFGFDEILIETVGVGQTGVGVRVLADVEVLVLTPGAGDYVQAMKAGIMETADLFVINKAELPGSDKLANELLGVLGRSSQRGAPVVIQVRAGDEAGVTELSTAIDRKFAQTLSPHAAEELKQIRRKYQVQRLIQRRLLEVLDSLPELTWSEPLLQRYQKTLEQLQADVQVMGRRSQGSNHE